MKAHELAKELGIGYGDMRDAAAKMGIVIPSPNMQLNKGIEQEIRAKVADDRRALEVPNDAVIDTRPAKATINYLGKPREVKRGLG